MPQMPQEIGTLRESRKRRTRHERIIARHWLHDTPLASRLGEQRWRNFLPGDEWWHWAIEHVADRPQQFGFVHVDRRIGTDAGGTGIDKPCAAA